MDSPRRFASLGPGMVRALGLVLAAVFCSAVAQAQQFQRQTASETGGLVSGSGQNLESNVGQSASAVVGDGVSNSVYSGYVNTDHAPGTVTNLAASISTASEGVQLQWTEVGADGLQGQAASVAIKFATSPITSQALYDAASTYAILTPLAPGGFESHVLNMLTPNATFYFAVEARDLAKNQGQLSNVPSTGTFGLPPAAITNLSAAEGAGGGAVVLDFTSPGANDESGPLNPGQFRIDYSTVAGTVFNFSNYQVDITTNTSPGVAQSPALSGLLGNATYYFDVFTGNSVPLFSEASNVASLLTLAYPPVAAAYSSVSSTAFTANWGLGNDTQGTQFFAEISLSPSFSPVLSSTSWSASLSATFSGLTPFTTYYAQVQARNAAGIATAYTSLGAVQLSSNLGYPTGIQVVSGNQTLTLSWNPVLSGAPTNTVIYRGLSASGPFSPLASLPLATVSYKDSGLTNGLTYYYELAESNSSEMSAFSPAVSGLPLSNLYPQGIVGISGAAQGTGFVVNWTQDMFNVNGASLGDLQSYQVFRATTVIGAVPVQLATVSTNTFTYTDVNGFSAAPAWYFVRAVDTSGNLSVWSLWVRSGAQLQYATVSPDFNAYALIPNGSVNTLTQQGIVLTWTDFPQDDVGRVADSYLLSAIRANTGQVVPDYVLPADTQFTFHYTARNPSTGGPEISDYFSPTDLSVFIMSDSQYVKIGGTVDTTSDEISAPSQQTGHYQVKASVSSDSFSILQTVPAKIFTPTQSGNPQWDTFTIYYDNPSDSPITQAKVYDITGAEVADLAPGANGSSLVWDGRAHGAGIAHAGIYIYQIKVAGKTFNGTVVLAR